MVVWCCGRMVRRGAPCLECSLGLLQLRAAQLHKPGAKGLWRHLLQAPPERCRALRFSIIRVSTGRHARVQAFQDGVQHAAQAEGGQAEAGVMRPQRRVGAQAAQALYD